MIIHAYKYHGAGNDFIILDNRKLQYNSLTTEQIKLLCDRHFGIGGDGLMLLEPGNRYEFSMRYFNADGHEGTMCGNGGRCLVAFAAHKGITNFEFEATDGHHHAEILELGERQCIVKLKMIDINQYQQYSENSYFLNTGSPHYVEFVEDVMEYPVDEKGKYWRWHKDFKGGTNVNFVEISDNKIKVRTYERGVEAETLACGTGATASSIATFLHSTKGFAGKTAEQTEHAQNNTRDNDQENVPNNTQNNDQNNFSNDTQDDNQNNFPNNTQDQQNSLPNDNTVSPNKQNSQTETVTYNIQALGANLSISFKYNKNKKTFPDIYLTGPATFVFETDIEI